MVASAAATAAVSIVGAAGSSSPLGDWQVANAIIGYGDDIDFLADASGIDVFFYVFASIFFVIVGFVLYNGSKTYFESRQLVEKVNKSKLKFITRQDDVTPEDQYDLACYYIALPDASSALAELDEVEEEFEGMRRIIDPEDAMGALCARAMLHNTKGFALAKLEPPRTAQARREYVRAVTFWPEFPEGLVNIGQELMKRRRFDVAVRTLNTALKWQPGNEDFQKAQVDAKRGLDKQIEKETYESDSDDDDEEELMPQGLSSIPPKRKF